jgi:hypothetical protein
MLLVLLSRRGRENKAGMHVEYGGGEVAAGRGSGGRGARKIGQQGRVRAAGDVQATRGEDGSRRWSAGSLHSGGGEVLCTGGRGGRGAEGG